jgi:hypothetical protein
MHWALTSAVLLNHPSAIPPPPPPHALVHDPHNDQNPQHASDHNQGAEGNQGLDDEVVPGCETQPDDIPGGWYEWHPDDIVPRVKNLINSTEYIKCLEAATLDNDSIPEYVRDRMQSPSTTPPHIDDDLCMCIGIFLDTINGSQATYDGVCRSIKQ